MNMNPGKYSSAGIKGIALAFFLLYILYIYKVLVHSYFSAFQRQREMSSGIPLGFWLGITSRKIWKSLHN